MKILNDLTNSNLLVTNVSLKKRRGREKTQQDFEIYCVKNDNYVFITVEITPHPLARGSATLGNRARWGILL